MPLPRWAPWALWGTATATGIGLLFWPRGAAALAAPGTLFTIAMENKSRSRITAGAAPYFTSLREQSLDTRGYRSGLHPSLPNYIQMTSGQTFGITDDTGHRIPGTDNLFAQMDAAGIAWKAYAEGARGPCDASSHGVYLERHVPALYYDSVRGDPGFCAAHVVPFAPAFAGDIAGATPRYVFVTPDAIHDMHDGTIAQGDAWLAQTVPGILASAAYRRGGALFVIWDEGDGGVDDLPAAILSPRVTPGATPAGNPTYDHKTYCATIQDLLGLTRLPATAAVPSLAPLFR
jgi:hypothetical protein